MPRVEVLADTPGRETETLLKERVPAEMLQDDHYAAQLVQRVGWALADAEDVESDPGS